MSRAKGRTPTLPTVACRLLGNSGATIVFAMASYVEAIQSLERERNELHYALHAAFKVRDKSPLKWQDWKLAAQKFSRHRPPIDPMLNWCYRSRPEPITPDLRNLMFDYMLVDPQFFRSGYLMERILRRVKRLSLLGEEKRIIRNLLLSRVRVKAFRNFRDICRLLPLIEDAELRAEVEELSRSQDASIRHRAAFALDYFSRSATSD